MYFLFKMGIFHCYVCLPEGTWMAIFIKKLPFAVLSWKTAFPKMLIFIAQAQREYKKDTSDTSWYWDPKTYTALSFFENKQQRYWRKLMLGIQSLLFGCLCKTQLWNVTTWFLPCQKGQGHLCCKPQDTGVVSSAYSNVTLQHSDLAKRKFNCLVVSCETELVTKLQIAVPQCCLSFSKSSPV